MPSAVTLKAKLSVRVNEDSPEMEKSVGVSKHEHSCSSDLSLILSSFTYFYVN